MTHHAEAPRPGYSLQTLRARAELPVRVPARASLLTRMETSPSQGVEVTSQGVEVLVLADQDFEDMFLADTQARLEHDHVALYYHLIPRPFSILTMTFLSII